MNKAWAGGGYDIPQETFDHYVGVAQQQMAMPAMPQDQPWYDPLDVIGALIDMGTPGYVLLGCTFVGAVTVGCFLIGRSTKFALVRRLMRTWGNLLKGD